MGIGAGVAIVGMGCRLPGGVYTPNQYWDFMLRRGDGIVEVPAERWNVDLFYDADPDAPGRAYTRHGGFVTTSPWDFDAEFFGISPREAEVMDPQQRWVLEVAWEALDDAGMAGRVSGRDVGVYVGGFMSDNLVRRHLPSARRAVDSRTATSGSLAMVSNRLSHALDLRGPSMTIDTACSSSLVAIHEATQAIAHGECEVALAGGVNVMVHPEVFVTMCKGGFLSPDGRSKSFDAAADGYGRGEGAGIIVLKPVEAAVHDGDRIYAVIEGTGANQDGRTMGITVPNGTAQRDLALRVCAQTGLSPDQVGYVEAHGTGTAVGDPIEVTALGEAYGRAGSRSRPLLIGSVKAAIGHLEAAAGVAGVIKAALAVHHSTIPPQARLDTLNPAIPFGDLNIEVATAVTAFPGAPGQAVAAVNGFGYGGTNAHVILTQAPQPVPPTETRTRPMRLLPISGGTDKALREMAAAMRGVVAGDSATDDICDAAWSRRAHHQFRTTVTYSDACELVDKLDEIGAGTTTVSRAIVPAGTKPVFVFSGMGPQWWGMGRELLTSGGIFSRTADEIDSVFTEIAGWSIVDELSKPEQTSRIHRTEFAQPANFLLQVSLAAELADLGVEPAAIVGHSVGEVTAAYVSGALTLRDALLVSHHRGRLQASTDGTGGMLAIGLSEVDAQQRLSESGHADVVIAAVNGSESVTVVGPVEAINTLHTDLESSGVFTRRLKVTVPYHCALMDPILDDLASALAVVEPGVPARPLYSTVTGAQVTGAEWDAAYWCANVRQQVRFAAAIDTLITDGNRVFLEVGPHPVVSGNIREVLARKAEPGVSVPTLRRGESDHDNVVRAVGELYQAGCLGSATPGSRRIATHVDLPGYPWQHARLFTESRAASLQRTGGSGERPLLGARLETNPMSWSAELSTTRLPWLPDHVVDGMVVLPGAAYLDAAFSAAAECTNHSSLSVESVRFLTPLVIEDHGVPCISVTVEPSTMRLAIASHAEDTGQRTVHCTGRIVDAAVEPPQADVPQLDGDVLSQDEFYARLESRGLHYGPAFRRVIDAKVGTDVVVATIDPGPPAGEHFTHPVVTDAALQALAALDGLGSATVVPAGIATVRRHDATPRHPVTGVVHRRSGPGIRADITLSGPDGVAFLELLDVEFAPLAPPVSAVTELSKLFYETEWQPLTAQPGGCADRPVVAVALGEHAGARLREVGVIEDAPIRPAQVADTLHALGGTGVTVLLMAGKADPVDLIAELLAVAKQINTVVAGQSVADIDAVLVTEGGFRVTGDRHELNLSHAALVGARRVLQNEQQSVRWRQVDLEPDDRDSSWKSTVLTELHDGAQRADEICIRHGVLFAPYLRRSLPGRLESYASAAPHVDPEESFALEAPKSRLLDDVVLRSVPRTAPGRGEIEVRMDAIGLNYKDSMKLVGLLTPENLRGTHWGTTTGMEGIGVVTRTGPGTRFRAGDNVLVSVPDIFRRYATIDPADGIVELLPEGAGTDFAGSFVPLLGAHYGLVHAARLGPGETVLVHGAAGGTGLAAVQVARQLGARVIGSAGTEERRAFARAAGAHHTVNSRSVNFVDDVMRLTDGRGADVIYTSLPGEALRQNLKAAAEFGRIVDIGKTDIYRNGTIELGPFDRNLSYFAIDMDRMFTYRRDLAVRLAEDVVARLGDGTYHLVPATTYDIGRLSEALSVVARAAQKGRVVVTLDGNPPVLPTVPRFSVRAEATYLVTGGFGAVGLVMADWLVYPGCAAPDPHGQKWRHDGAGPPQAECMARSRSRRP